MIFDLQRFRDPQDTLYRGRRRINGNFGRVYLNGELVWELSEFELKMTAEREDIWIGNSKDSKITGLTGEGTLTIKLVFDRGFKDLLENWKRGLDPRVSLVGVLDDPDSPNDGAFRISVENVWFNDLDLLSFSKNAVVERQITFGFTPEDVNYLETVKL